HRALDPARGAEPGGPARDLPGGATARIPQRQAPERDHEPHREAAFGRGHRGARRLVLIRARRGEGSALRLVAASFIAWPGAAPAPAAVPQDPVVVTATRTETRVFDAPAAIGVVDADTIGVAGPQVNLSESLSRVAGIAILNRQNYAQDLQLSIRGF